MDLVNAYPSIKLVNLQEDKRVFSTHLADCVILTQNHTILMQQRPENWGKFSGALNIFGGHVESGEHVMDGLVRELHEELGATVRPEDVTFIGAMTENWTDHAELVHIHFWHDKKGTITGCYEGEAYEYKTVKDALSHPKIMDYAAWALLECQRRKLLP